MDYESAQWDSHLFLLSPGVLPQVGHVWVDNALGEVTVDYTPTIPHCSMATVIGLSLRVKLLRSLPSKYKVHPPPPLCRAHPPRAHTHDPHAGGPLAMMHNLVHVGARALTTIQFHILLSLSRPAHPLAYTPSCRRPAWRSLSRTLPACVSLPFVHSPSPPPPKHSRPRFVVGGRDSHPPCPHDWLGHDAIRNLVGAVPLTTPSTFTFFYR